MAKTIIAKKELKGDWWNLTLNTGQEVSVFTGTDKNGKASNPALHTELINVTIGGEVDMDVKPGKDGTKMFGWEVRAGGAGGGKGFAPADKPFQGALSAAQAASNMLSLTKDPTKEQFDTWFDHIHAKIMSTKTS